MSNDDYTLVLTTREKEWWWSLQEIFPSIERVWTEMGRGGQERVRTLCVPLTPDIKHDVETSAAEVKRIVLITATPGTVEVALFLRLQLKVSAPMIVYVHGDSTEGFHAFGDLANALTESDILVVSCESEAAATRLCFPNAQIRIIPFPLVDQFKLIYGERESKPKGTRLAYVGRVAEQKNLHTILFALWILRNSYNCTSRITLDVYGGESNLGSPMMDLKHPGYEVYLRGLAESLGVADMVTWHGTKPRDWLFYNVHMEPYIFVHPTLLSDENFGSSILASLVNGHQVVASAWGGPRGWQEWFPQQLTLVPVSRSIMGPVVHPVTLASAILRAMDRTSAPAMENATLDQAREEFSVSGVAKHTSEMLNQPFGDPVPLNKSPILRHLEERRVLFGGARRIYADYADPAAQIFFEAYGMKEPLTYDEESSYVLAPWTSCSDGILHIDDPHRGSQVFNLDAEIARPVDVAMPPAMNTCRLSESLVKKLVAQGYAFSIPSKHTAR